MDEQVTYDDHSDDRTLVSCSSFPRYSSATYVGIVVSPERMKEIDDQLAAEKPGGIVWGKPDETDKAAMISLLSQYYWAITSPVLPVLVVLAVGALLWIVFS